MRIASWVLARAKTAPPATILAPARSAAELTAVRTLARVLVESPLIRVAQSHHGVAALSGEATWEDVAARLALHLWDLGRVENSEGARDHARWTALRASRLVSAAQQIGLPRTEYEAGLRTLWLGASRVLRRAGR